jgi:catechol 2,3-dioxygenase-like lactoylglutathione lyase family enzyme
MFSLLPLARRSHLRKQPHRTDKTNAANMRIIGHASFGVHDMSKMTTFYDAVLATLGSRRCKEVTWKSAQEHQPDKVPANSSMDENQLVAVGYGQYYPEFWIQLTRPVNGDANTVPLFPPNPQTHMAFSALSEVTVQQFHQTALAAGGKCNGPPGIRLQCGPTYYAAYVLDPEGNHLEAYFVNT